MNSEGQIREFKTEKEAIDAGFKITLTRQEYNQMLSVPDKDRAREVEWMRFIKLRKVALYERIKMRQAWDASWAARESYIGAIMPEVKNEQTNG